eukprot:COSAG02_NODE_1388_length_12920_cov_8.638122_8_plen_300_part_00
MTDCGTFTTCSRSVVLATSLSILHRGAHAQCDAKAPSPPCACAPGVDADACEKQCVIPTPYGSERDCGFPGVKADDCMACHPSGPDPERCKAVGCCYGGGSATVPSCFFGNGDWPPATTSVGGSMFAVLAIVALIYVVSGVAYGSRLSGQPLALHLHPHFDRWQRLAGLCNDGMAYISGRGRGSGQRMSSGYKKLSSSCDKGAGRDVQELSSGAKERPVMQAAKERRGKHKKNRGGKSKTGTPDSACTSKGRNATDSPVLTTTEADHGTVSHADASTSATVTSAGTAAGDGGRWVRVPD